MTPSPDPGSDRRPGLEDATLVDDPNHPRQREMRALVDAERARLADEAAHRDDVTRRGQLVPNLHVKDEVEGDDGSDTSSALVRAASLLPEASDIDAGSERKTVHDFAEIPLPRVSQGPDVRSRAESLTESGWVELEDNRPMSLPMVRVVSDESLAKVPAAPPHTRPILSTNPPPGPERSVVVHQVSPFGSDARVVAKPKRLIPPQHETVPFQPTRPEARKVSERPDGNEVRPQRYLNTVIQPAPVVARTGESPLRLVPVTSALGALFVAVAALMNALN